MSLVDSDITIIFWSRSCDSQNHSLVEISLLVHDSIRWQANAVNRYQTPCFKPSLIWRWRVRLWNPSITGKFDLFFILGLWTKQTADRLLHIISHLELQHDIHYYSNSSSFVHQQLLWLLIYTFPVFWRQYRPGMVIYLEKVTWPWTWYLMM